MNGDLDFKAPDFVAFVNALNLDYSPKSYALGLFSLSGRLAGNSSIFKLTDMNAFVGANNFKGTLWVDKSGAKPNIVTELAITRFEPERFSITREQRLPVRPMPPLLCVRAAARMRPISLPGRFGIKRSSTMILQDIYAEREVYRRRSDLEELYFQKCGTGT